MEWVLVQFVKSFDAVNQVIQWSIQNPGAALLWGGVLGALLNYIVKLTPTQIDDSLYTALKRAISEGIEKLKKG